MSLFMVYDAKGEPFEVLPALAKSLVIQHGWSMTKPVVIVAPTAPIEPPVHETDAEAAAKSAESTHA